MPSVLTAVCHLLAIVVSTLVAVDFQQYGIAPQPVAGQVSPLVAAKRQVNAAVKPALPCSEPTVLSLPGIPTSYAKVRRLTTDALVTSGCFSFCRTVLQVNVTIVFLQRDVTAPSRQILYCIWRF